MKIEGTKAQRHRGTKGRITRSVGARRAVPVLRVLENILGLDQV